MSSCLWITENDVLEDLTEVGGPHLMRVSLSTKACNNMVRGNDRPPPLSMNPEDDEATVEQFGDLIREGRTSIHSENPPPDLQGITELIRMVQGCDEEGDNEDLDQASNCVIAITKPTKLNPEVKEFVPRATSSHSSNLSEGEGKQDQQTLEIEPKEEESPTQQESDLATKLKNEISDSNKCDSYKAKKQKNVAIAALLRLYANNSPKPQTVTEPVKLITPEFYATRTTPTKEVKLPVLETPPLKSATPGPKTAPSSIPSGSSNDVRSEPVLHSKEPPKPKLDPAIKVSIEKVNQWMGDTVEKKAPAVCLAPVTFKKKTPQPQNLKPSEQEKVKEENVGQPKQWKPSSIATDLVKKYMENSKKKEKQNVNMWTDLDLVLKQRDEVVLAKQIVQQSGE